VATAIPVLRHEALGLPTFAKSTGATQTSGAGARFRIERLGAEIDHDAWRTHLLLQQLAQQPLGGLLVAAALHQDVEQDTGLVYSSP
jgi:hypothetical protein